MPTHATHPLRFLRGLSRSATSCSSVLAAGSCAQLGPERTGLTSSSPVSSVFPGVGKAEAARAVASNECSGFFSGVAPLPLPLPLPGSLKPCLSEESEVIAILGLTSSLALSLSRREEGPAALSGPPGRDWRFRCGLRGVLNAASEGGPLSGCAVDALAVVAGRRASRQSASHYVEGRLGSRRPTRAPCSLAALRADVMPKSSSECLLGGLRLAVVIVEGTTCEACVGRKAFARADGLAASTTSRIGQAGPDEPSVDDRRLKKTR